MADAAHIPDKAKACASWCGFAITGETLTKAQTICTRYLGEHGRLAVTPLIDLARHRVLGDAHMLDVLA